MKRALSLLATMCCSCKKASSVRLRFSVQFFESRREAATFKNKVQLVHTFVNATKKYEKKEQSNKKSSCKIMVLSESLISYSRASISAMSVENSNLSKVLVP